MPVIGAIFGSVDFGGLYCTLVAMVEGSGAGNSGYSVMDVRPDGTIGSPLAAGPEAIKALVTQTVGAPGQEVPVQPTAPQGAPGEELPMQQTAQGKPCPNCGKVGTTIVAFGPQLSCRASRRAAGPC